MKKLILILAAAIIVFSGCNSKKEKMFTLTVKNIEMCTQKIECDSFQMTSIIQCSFWVDGHQMDIVSDQSITPCTN
jgi:hypothetical protein